MTNTFLKLKLDRVAYGRHPAIKEGFATSVTSATALGLGDESCSVYTSIIWPGMNLLCGCFEHEIYVFS